MLRRELAAVEMMYRYADLDSLLLLYSQDSYEGNTPLAAFLQLAASSRKATLNDLLLKVRTYPEHQYQ